MRFLRQNLGLKILSLVLAVVLWAGVRLVGGPTGETPAQRVFTVPIRVTEPERPDLVVEPALREVTLTLKGSRSVIDKVRPALIRVDVDLTSRGPGNYLEKVNVLTPGGTDLVESEPTHIGVKISARKSAQVPVEIEVKGQAADGFQVGKALVDPPSVKIFGPEDNVQKVVKVVGQIALSGRKQGESAMVKGLVPVNDQGMEVSLVKILPEAVAVTVPVDFAARVLGVKVDYRNVKASAPPGWQVALKAEPDIVTLQGPPGAEAPSAVSTEQVVFPESTEPETREIKLLPPEGFTVVGSPVVKVTAVPSRKRTSEAPPPTPETPQ